MVLQITLEQLYFVCLFVFIIIIIFLLYRIESIDAWVNSHLSCHTPKY